MVQNSFKFITFIAFSVVMIACQSDQPKDCDYVKTYYPTIYQADYAFESKDYEKAYSLYKSAFANCEALSTPDYDEMQNFAAAAAAVKDYQTTLTYAKKLIAIGEDLDYFENRSVFQNFLGSEQGQALYDDYDNLKERYKKKIDLKLRHRITGIVKEDKRYYTDRSYSSQQRDSIDQAHKKELKTIFEENGYPNSGLIGVYSIDRKNTDLSNVLLHIRDSSRIDYFIPKLRKFVARGEAPPRILGNLVDQYRLYHGQDQRYGTFVKADGTYLEMPQDRKQVDKDRRSIGMPTLEMERKKDSLIRH